MLTLKSFESCLSSDVDTEMGYSARQGKVPSLTAVE